MVCPSRHRHWWGCIVLNWVMMNARLKEASLKVLLTGARAPVTLELARTFARAGHTVLAADSVARHLLQASNCVSRSVHLPKPRPEPERFLDVLEDVVRRDHVDLIVPTCEEVFWLARGLDRLPAFVSPLETLAELHDKSRFVRLASSLGIRVPRTALLEHQDDLERLKRTGKIVLKPAFSRFAANTMVLEPDVKLPKLEPRPNQPWLAQAFIEGPEMCAFAVAQAGRVTAFVAYQPLWRAGLGASVHFASLRPDDAVVVEALEITKRIVQHTQFTGQIAFDFIQSARGLVVLECNPRATSGIHLFGPEDHLERAYLHDLETPLQPQRQTKAMLAVPMLLYGLPRAISERRVLEWWRDFKSARDVIFDRGDLGPSAWQLPCVLETLREALRLGSSVLSATTADIEWNGETVVATSDARVEWVAEERARSIAPLRGLLADSSTHWVQNAKTRIRLLECREHVVPVTVNHGEPGNTYVLSPITHYVTYAIEELRELGNPALERVFRIVLEGLGAVLRWAKADDVVHVNNWLVSTNLHPPLTLEDVRAITHKLTLEYPQYAIAFRSVHGFDGERLPEYLLECGYGLLPARSVLFVDAPAGRWRRRRDSKNDLRLLEASPYRLRKLKPDEPRATLERAKVLYDKLYLRKYSLQNPQFSVAFFHMALEMGLLDFFVLEHDGRVDGVLGVYERFGMMAAPILAYDTDLPQDLGLYRILSTHLSLEAQKRGVILHASSGVAAFKRSRGAIPVIEHTAVYTSHLPWSRRIVWRGLEWLLRYVAVPIIARTGL